ncbi:MAG: Asp-tRNA(Asn)/Glu-tRNA(Gln) amidotransferase subunit GatB [Candidatus Beckwithbacteria bacterium]|nr:Asp-tRNA(Asn)/Glu-tRNA(Gln) amidotransferase subunit GatB [Candidatus Beckwithbacteria bacterium]
MKNLQPTIGIEVHVELKTNSKMFCGCPADHFAKKPNTQTCPVCLGLPGALPVPNKKAIDWTILLGLAFNCQINKISKFDRKHYFYPDLPKGYQISQYDQPLCVNGYLTLDSGKKIRITRIHQEEDTAKLIHKKVNGQDVTLVDFNRSGVPLTEIVTEPDITSGKEAKEFLKKLHELVRALKISDCDMEKGSMRLEANISLTDNPKKLANYKVEVKNLNSFRFVEAAINYELNRQSSLLQEGITPTQETRGYDDLKKETYTQRVKESAQDYRYFPEPDIPPLEFTDKDIELIRRQLPKLPHEHLSDLVKKFGLNETQAKALVKDSQKLTYFHQYAAETNPTNLANLIINKKIDLTKPFSGQLKTTTQSVDQKIIDQVLKENTDAVKKYQAGKSSVLGFLVGQVMRQTYGKSAPQLIQKLLLSHLRGVPTGREPAGLAK